MGPRGPPGVKGDAGDKGDRGSIGPKGDAGSQGPKGDSARDIYIRSATQPPTPSGLTINSAGVFTNLTSGTLTWNDVTPVGTDPVWVQPLQIDWSTAPTPTITTLGAPFRQSGEPDLLVIRVYRD